MGKKAEAGRKFKVNPESTKRPQQYEPCYIGLSGGKSKGLYDCAGAVACHAIIISYCQYLFQRPQPVQGRGA